MFVSDRVLRIGWHGQHYYLPHSVASRTFTIPHVHV